MVIASLEPLRVYVYGDTHLLTAAFPFIADPAEYGNNGIHLTNAAVANRLREQGADVPLNHFGLADVLARGPIAGLSERELWVSATCRGHPRHG